MASTVPRTKASSTSAMERVIGLAPSAFSADVWVRPEALTFIPLKSARVLTALLPHKAFLAAPAPNRDHGFHDAVDFFFNVQLHQASRMLGDELLKTSSGPKRPDQTV